MSKKQKPRYPIYIPSKGRYKNCHTVKFLIRDSVSFYIVVEPREADEYASRYGSDCLLVLPRNDVGLLGARNWIMDHSIELGAERHWQLDDNAYGFERFHKGKRIYCDSNVALRVVEDFSDRYENIAISGMNYHMFGIDSLPPFYLNVHVYSSTLINNVIEQRWRLRYNDDTDLCLQVLANGWCTILFNAFLFNKIVTMVVKGGNTDDLYHGDGRLKMARSLERMWPGVVETKRRYNRPQHVIKKSWRRFDTPLKLKAGIDLAKMKPNNYGLKLVQVKDEIRSEEIRKLLDLQE